MEVVRPQFEQPNWSCRPWADTRSRPVRRPKADSNGRSVSNAAEVSRSDMCDELTHPAMPSHSPMIAVRPRAGTAI